MTRLYGRAPRGERVVEAVPHGRWTTTTILSAIRVDGVAAAMLTEGAVDGTVFRGFVEWRLLPALRRGDIVVMDNLAAHKRADVVALIESAGAEVWFLPPYSPDLNPIEMAWAKVKALLRRAAARTTDALYDAVAEALRAITPADCQGFFRACGYRVT